MAGALEAFLGTLGRLAVLVSGGIDSEVLLRAAADVLGPGNVLALTADTRLLAGYHRERIRDLCRSTGSELSMVRYDPLAVAGVLENGPDRCYHCKKAVYGILRARALSMGFQLLADGTSVDDLDGDRPGLRAAREECVLHPFVAAGMGKAEIRELAAGLGVSDPWRPSDSCLATRIPRGTRLTADSLALVERLEEPLKPLARRRTRVRLEAGGAVLEYSEADAPAVDALLDEITRRASEAGVSLRVSPMPP